MPRTRARSNAAATSASMRAGTARATPLAPRAPQQPQAPQRQRGERRPAQQPVVAVDPQPDQAVGAVQPPVQRVRQDRARRPGASAASGARPPYRRALTEAKTIEREEHDLERHQAADAPAPAREPARDRERHDRRRDQLGGPQPRQRGRPARRRAAPCACAGGRARAAPRSTRRPAAAAGGQLGRDRGGVGQRRRREPGDDGRGRRVRLGHQPPRDADGERERQRRDRGQEQLDRHRPAERVGGRDEQREAGARRARRCARRSPIRAARACPGTSPRRRATGTGRSGRCRGRRRSTRRSAGSAARRRRSPRPRSRGCPIVPA